jgi:hypothetical protein
MANQHGTFDEGYLNAIAAGGRETFVPDQVGSFRFGQRFLLFMATGISRRPRSGLEAQRDVRNTRAR